jgi:Rrf2 family protein
LQVLRILVTHNLLHSTRGVDGGYYLTRPPKEITLSEIVSAFDNPLELNLPDVDFFSKDTRQHVFQTLRHAADAARTQLEKVTLDDLIERGDLDLRLCEEPSVS